MHIRKLRKNIGLFSNINNAIRHIIYVNEFGENPFYIQWKSAFYQSNSGENLWNKLFNQPFFNESSSQYDSKNIKELPQIIEKYPRYITPINGNNLMINPIKKDYVHSIIQKHIQFDKKYIDLASKFLKNHKNKYKIGLHIRGSGHLHNGTKVYRKKFKMINKIPIPEYINHLEKKIKEIEGEYTIIIFTDNNFVINYFKERYDIVTYDSERADNFYGEVHVHTKNKKLKEKLCEDIIVETLIMSQCDYLIHGMSNITNFVQCYNPKLNNKNIYDCFF
jgi:hypothetical protein